LLWLLGWSTRGELTQLLLVGDIIGKTRPPAREEPQVCIGAVTVFRSLPVFTPSLSTLSARAGEPRAINPAVAATAPRRRTEVPT
jgi:hypothetical protein